MKRSGLWVLSGGVVLQRVKNGTGTFIHLSPNIKKQDTGTIRQAKVLLHSQTGVFRTGEALQGGIHSFHHKC